jgi:hypothetical protein
MNYESKPFKPDFDVAHFTIIGREKCYVDTLKNDWLISLTFLPSGKTYGPDVSYGGIIYKNVVKIFLNHRRQVMVCGKSAKVHIEQPHKTSVHAAQLSVS